MWRFTGDCILSLTWLCDIDLRESFWVELGSAASLMVGILAHRCYTSFDLGLEAIPGLLGFIYMLVRARHGQRFSLCLVSLVLVK